MNSSDPRAVVIPAGRETLKRTADYLDARVSFAIETTFSSRSTAGLIGKAKSLGYEVHLLFVALDTPERCIRRIRNRTALGGHLIPDTDVRRRYGRSIANAALAIRVVDTAYFYDNSGDGLRLILTAEAGVVVWRENPLPEWVRL
jgi:predicted ABC-type ATPase